MESQLGSYHPNIKTMHALWFQFAILVVSVLGFPQKIQGRDKVRTREVTITDTVTAVRTTTDFFTSIVTSTPSTVISTSTVYIVAGYTQAPEATNCVYDGLEYSENVGSDEGSALEACATKCGKLLHSLPKEQMGLVPFSQFFLMETVGGVAECTLI